MKVKQPYFLKHEKFTIPSLIEEIFQGIRKLFSYFCNVNDKGINLSSELFFTCCFHLFIDPRGKFVTIKILGVEEDINNPFFEAFKTCFKTETFVRKEWELEEI